MDLPRICVVGKQSSGKSSVMEALTGLGRGDDDALSTPYPPTGIINLELWKMYVCLVERVLEAQVPEWLFGKMQRG